MSFFSNLFNSPQSQANQDIYNDYSSLSTPEAIERKYGLKKRRASDVSQTFNPARANLATRQAQANQAAGARMTGSNATPQTTFGGVTSSFAPAWGNLEGEAATKGLDVERSDEDRIAQYLRNAQTGRSNAAQNLSQTSPFNDIVDVGATALKFINPALGSAVQAVGNAGGNAGVSPVAMQDYTKLFGMPDSLSGGGFSSPLNSSLPSGTLSINEPQSITQDTGGNTGLGNDLISGGTSPDDGSWGMNKKHGYNKKLGKYGFWNTNNPNINFQQ